MDSKEMAQKRWSGFSEAERKAEMEKVRAKIHLTKKQRVERASKASAAAALARKAKARAAALSAETEAETKPSPISDQRRKRKSEAWNLTWRPEFVGIPSGRVPFATALVRTAVVKPTDP